jgi:tRNA G18 (ribose-2'-O)-methylase SpoU
VSARGHFGIGILNGKAECNLGTLWRSAHGFGADWLFTIGRRYPKQSSDTTKAWRHVPLFEFRDFDAFLDALPRESLVVAVELAPGARELSAFTHPERAAYLLGAEDAGIPADVLARCHRSVYIPHADRCLNVATAGSIVLYDRCANGPRGFGTARRIA